MRRRLAWLALVAIVLTGIARRPGVQYRFWRWTASFAPADPTCASTTGAHAALLNGALPAKRAQPCSRVLVGPDGRWAPLLERLVQDPDRPADQRLTAAVALAAERRLPTRLARAVLAGPGTPPAMRRGLVRWAGVGPEGVELAGMAREAAIHDGWRVGGLVLDGMGEPGFGRAAERALTSRPEGTLAPWMIEALGWGHPAALRRAQERAHAGQQSGPYAAAGAVLQGTHWGRDGAATVLALTRWRADEAGEALTPPQPPLAAGDALLSQIATEPVADSVREEIHAVAEWVKRGPPDGRARRLIAVVAHAEAAPARDAEAWRGEPGLGPLLEDGAGGPAHVVFLATALGASVGVPVVATATPGAAQLRIGGMVLQVDACGGRTRTTEVGAPTSERAWAARLLRAEAGARLRRGEWSDAVSLLEGAAALGEAGPDSAAGDLLLAALQGPSAAPSTGVTMTVPLAAELAPATRRRPADLVPASIPVDRGPPPSDGDARDRLIAAWWLARMGEPAAARGLLAGAETAWPDLAGAVRALIGEPGRVVGPVGQWVDGSATAPWAGCPGESPLSPAPGETAGPMSQGVGGPPR